MLHYYQNLGENWFDYQEIYTEFADNCTNDSVIVEVGSWVGRSISFLGVELLNRGKSPKVYCVDTWLGSKEHNNDYYTQGGHELLKDKNNDSLYKMFLKNIEPIKKVLTLLRLPSVEAAKTFADGSIDFLFLDASHEEEDVYRDITEWYPKIKTGGVFSGHDYGDAWVGVRMAVNKHPFMAGTNFKIRCGSSFYKIK